MVLVAVAMAAGGDGDVSDGLGRDGDGGFVVNKFKVDISYSEHGWIFKYGATSPNESGPYVNRRAK